MARGAQVRLAAEAATIGIGGIILATALLPSIGGTSRGALLTTTFALLAFDALWFHVLPPRYFRRDRFMLGAAIAQVIAGWLVAGTGGVSSPYFSFFLLPTLATVFDLHPRRTLIVGAVASATYLAVAILVRPAPAASNEVRDAAIIHGLALVGLVLLCTVITRTLAQTRDRLVREEGRHRALIAALGDPFLTTTPDGTITAVNAAAATFFGGRDRLVGHPIGEVLPFAPVPSGWRSAGTFRGALSVPTNAAAEVEVSLAPLSSRGGSGGAYVVHDISEHVAISRLREQLLFSVAHELRAPLAVLDNALEIIEADYASLDAAEFDELVGTARRTSRRLHALMDDLLSAGSIQSGRFVVRLDQVELRAIVDAATDLVRPMLRERGQSLEVDVPDVAVLADPRHAPHVLTNLLSNAAKYSPDGGSVRVSASAAGGLVRVAVEDRGRGIAASDQPRLFERFYRVRGVGEEPGVGLGLAIAKGIVEAHGGSIGVESEIGRGTTIWFTLRAADRAAA